MSLRPQLRSFCRAYSFLALATVAILAVLATGAAAPAVTTLYWDQNSALGGTGAWDNNNTANWTTTNTSAPPSAKWNPNDGTVDAQFGGSATSTVTVSSGIKANSIIFDNTNLGYTFNGGTLEITTGAINFTTNVNSSTTAQNFGTTPITVTGGGDLVISNNTNISNNQCCGLTLTNTSTYKDLRINGAISGTTAGRMQVSLNNLNAINNTSATNHATVYLDRDGAQLAWGNTVFDGKAFYPDIVLNTSGSATAPREIIGATASNEIDLMGTIRSNGPANLAVFSSVSGGTGVFNLHNAASYSGYTEFANGNLATGFGGTLRNVTGANNALPVTTRLIFGAGTGAAAAGTYDLNGFSQTITGIATSGNPNAIGGVVNTSANQGTLVIKADATYAPYTGTIGVSALKVYAHTGGTYAQNDNIAVVLDAASAAGSAVTFAAAAGNTYTGGTTINGGTLLVSNTSGSGTGTGTVSVPGGALGGTGSVSGAVNVTGGRLTPGDTNSLPNINNGLTTTGTLVKAIGTLTLNGGATLGSGAKVDIDLGAPPSSPTPGTPASDLVSAFGTGVTVTGGAGSIGVNLNDPAGGAAGNGTYTLITFPQGQYAGSTNASQFVTNSLPNPNSLNGATIAYHLADNNNAIQEGANAVNATRVIMTVSGGPNALIWKGQNSFLWDVSNTANFVNSTDPNLTPVTFANNDNVVFDDTSGQVTLNVASGGVRPNEACAVIEPTVELAPYE